MVSLPDWMMGGKYPSELSVNHSGADWSLSFQTGSRLGLIDLVSQPASLSNPILRGDFEDNLFMYYLDHVFYIYCPFYFPSNRQGRGWLFSILKRVKSAYHAALALSEYHYSTPTRHSSSYSARSMRGYYDLALGELQSSLVLSSTWTGNLGITYNIEVLTTIVHLLFYEVRSCWSLY